MPLYQHQHQHQQNMTIELNIGLAVSPHEGGGQITAEAALWATAKLIGRVTQHRVAQSATEPTLCCRVTVPHGRDVRKAVSRLALALGQDCIAAVPGDGTPPFLAGPRAAAWGAFDPAFWLPV